MNQTPNSNRIHITLLGKRNAGKSSLLNAITGQEVSLVSSIMGTTTDPVNKAMELLPLGPVLFIDTAGVDDEGELGDLRVEKTMKVLQKTDFALYVMDVEDIEKENYFKETEKQLKKYHIPYMVIANQIDKLSKDRINEIIKKYPQYIFISTKDASNILHLKEEIISRIEKKIKEPPIIGDLIPHNGNVVLVVPIDSEAPKGRIILPQVQVIRDCLDHGIKSHVVRDTELKSALQDIKHIDLVITDSQAFKKVEKIIPSSMKLTSFSILFARYKGDLNVFLEGIHYIDDLPEKANILITESCTHNHSHEDIGRVKIPKMLNNYAKKNFNYHFKTGHDFPRELSDYDLIIHCGSCMLNPKTMETRINLCKKEKVPITNYGVLLAHLTGILDRTIEIFK